MDTRTKNDLLAAAFAAVRPLDLQFTVLAVEPPLANHLRPDAAVRLNFGGQNVDYAVELRRNLRPATLGALLHHLADHRQKALLVADYVPPPMADTLRANDVQFIDAAGNAYLNQPPLLVWVKGERPAETLAQKQPQGRAFQATGLQVVFTLLCKPEAANLPYRDIAALAGVAHGTVGWVMPDLLRLGFLIEIKKKRRLVEAEQLLKQWVEAYPRTLRPKLLAGRYDVDTLAWTEQVDATKYGLLLGGEPAARRITGHLRPGTATFYGEKPDTRLMVDYRLRPEPRGNVEVLRKFWNFDGEAKGLVPTVLIYADLIATGDARCLETAREIYGGVVDGFA